MGKQNQLNSVLKVSFLGVFLFEFLMLPFGCNKKPATEGTNTNSQEIEVTAESNDIKIVSPGEISVISIMTPNVWNLQIVQDGSGFIVWATSSHPNSGAVFPKGTLDFQKAVKSLQSISLSEDEKNALLSVSFFHKNESSAVSQQIPVESGWAKELFTKAYLSSNKTGTRVEELWKKYPPFSDNGNSESK